MMRFETMCVFMLSLIQSDSGLYMCKFPSIPYVFFGDAWQIDMRSVEATKKKHYTRIDAKGLPPGRCNLWTKKSGNVMTRFKSMQASFMMSRTINNLGKVRVSNIIWKMRHDTASIACKLPFMMSHILNDSGKHMRNVHLLLFLLFGDGRETRLENPPKNSSAKNRSQGQPSVTHALWMIT